MANQIALRLHTEPGDELLGEENCHVFLSELGGPAVHSGVVTRGLPGRRGPLQRRAGARGLPRPDDPLAAHARALDREHAQRERRPDLAARGDRRRCTPSRSSSTSRFHLDGARLLNAAVATGIDAAEIGGRFDTVTLCLSKGLGCPLGAILAGQSEVMGNARRLQAPLRRRDASGRDRRRSRRLRARPPRRPARRRPPPRASGWRSASPRPGSRSIPTGPRRTSSSSTSRR